MPKEATEIPDYRQLLLTKKFAKFSRCTCDHPKQQGDDDTKVSSCRKHRHRSVSPKSSSSSSSSTDDDELNLDDDGNESSSSSSSSSSCSSSKAAAQKTEDTGLEQGEIVDDENDFEAKKTDKNSHLAEHRSTIKEEEKFEDIRSMELHRKQNHPERLHPDLSFNEPDQVISTRWFVFIDSITLNLKNNS